MFMKAQSVMKVRQQCPGRGGVARSEHNSKNMLAVMEHQACVSTPSQSHSCALDLKHACVL